jgi:hypothetical protein
MWTKEECNDHWRAIFLIRHIRRKEFVRTLQTLSSKGRKANVCFESLGEWHSKRDMHRHLREFVGMDN